MKKLFGLLLLGGVVAVAVFLAWKRQTTEARPRVDKEVEGATAETGETHAA